MIDLQHQAMDETAGIYPAIETTPTERALLDAAITVALQPGDQPLPGICECDTEGGSCD